MPKVSDTRRQKAAELVELIKDGPAFSSISIKASQDPATAKILEGIKADYRIWASSWVAPLVTELVPELAKAEKAKLQAEREAEIKEYGGVRMGDHILIIKKG